METIDLTNCDREPIRIPGAIQPHGCLVVIGAEDCLVTHASGNLAGFFGRGPGDVIGRPLSTLLEDEDLQRLVLAAGGDGTYGSVRRGAGDGALDAIIHRSGHSVILEFEPRTIAGVASVSSLYRLTWGAVTRLRRSASLAESYGICATRIREISGFDRVMVYRFDDDWNGTVIAEDRRDDLEPFLGLHYPASDIPRQARELYARNWLRFIADRDYLPVPILPPSGPDATSPLDLGHAVLRSVSPIHIEYLRNMGVGASMSISLLKGERLWGLVACHHYSPRYVPYDVRTACELLGQVMSMQLVAREEREQSAYGDRIMSTRAALADRVGRSDRIDIALTEGEPTILDLLEATGAAVILDGEVSRIGLTPGPGEILEIAERIGDEQVFATDSLGPAIGLEAVGAVSAGVLSVAISAGGLDRILWFRPEQVREVNWAGDPSKSVEKGAGGVRLSPRGSFALWKEVVRGRSRPWSPAEVAAASDLRRDVAEALIGRAGRLSRQNLELRRGEAAREEMLASERAARVESERLGRMKDSFVATLSHELRTPLTAIIGWTSILRRSNDAGTVRQAVEVIERNARAQASMIDELLDMNRIATGKLRLDVQAVDLAAVVAAALDTVAPAAQAKGVRLERLLDPLVDAGISGDPIRLQQILWNLLSNAVKFTPRGGKVQVLLERVDSHVEVCVADTGQGIDAEFLPHVFDRFQQEDASTNRQHGGLGLGLSIARHLVELHGGTIHARSEGPGSGSTFCVSLPLRAVARPDRRPGTHPTRPAGPLEADALDLRGVRVLVVDDEADSREMLRRILQECGATAVAAGDAEEALQVLRGGEIDVFISDIGMPGVDGYELIKRVRDIEAAEGRPRTPAVALTAYARPEDRRRVLLSGYQLHVAKPVEPAEITAVIANLVGRV